MIDRPRIPLGQKILGGLIVISVLVLSGSSFFLAQSSINKETLLISADRPTKSFAIAENAALVYVIHLERWSAGLTELRNVQVTRVLLLQKLSFVDNKGNSPIALASPELLNALRESEVILQSAVPGFLPVELQKSVQVKIGPISDQIISQSKALVDAFQLDQNSKIRESANSRLNLLLVIPFSLFLFLVLFTIFGVGHWRSTYSYFRQSQTIIQHETEKLNGLIEELSLSESTIENLRELSETKTAFIASVNHELRTPLSSIIGYVEIIRDITDNKPELGITEYLEVVDRNANVLLELVNSILTLAKLDSSNSSLPISRIDIGQVIDTAISILKPECKKSNIDIYFSITEGVDYFIQGDAGQLNRVFLNLLSNSIKFSEINSHIEIEVDRLDYENAFSFVKIVIRDHGIGIPAKELERQS